MVWSFNNEFLVILAFGLGFVDSYTAQGGCLKDDFRAVLGIPLRVLTKDLGLRACLEMLKPYYAKARCIRIRVRKLTPVLNQVQTLSHCFVWLRMVSHLATIVSEMIQLVRQVFGKWFNSCDKFDNFST